MGYTGIPTFGHTQIRLGQLLLDAEGVQLGRRGVLSPAMGPLDKSTCCVFSGNCLKNVGRSTSSEQPGLLMSSPTKLGGLRVWETSSLWGTSSNQNDIGDIQCTTCKENCLAALFALSSQSVRYKLNPQGKHNVQD